MDSKSYKGLSIKNKYSNISSLNNFSTQLPHRIASDANGLFFLVGFRKFNSLHEYVFLSSSNITFSLLIFARQ